MSQRGRLDTVLEVIDVGLQTAGDEALYEDNGLCVRCQVATPARGSSWCTFCTGPPGTERSLWYDRTGQPISMLEWERLFFAEEYKRIAATDHGDWWVSTVWVGISSSYDGPPLIFETMVFGASDIDCIQMRSPTEDAAREVHAHLVGYLRVHPLPVLPPGQTAPAGGGPS